MEVESGFRREGAENSKCERPMSGLRLYGLSANCMLLAVLHGVGSLHVIPAGFRSVPVRRSTRPKATSRSLP